MLVSPVGRKEYDDGPVALKECLSHFIKVKYFKIMGKLLLRINLGRATR